jgi:hypothetical protein
VGKLSLNETPLNPDAFALLTLKVTDVVPLRGMLAAPKALLIVGGASTVMLAFAVLPVPPSVELTCTLLCFTPAVVPVTFAEIVQEALDPSVPPDKFSEEAPAAAVAVPPQVLLRLLGVATTKPAGRLSVNAIPFSVMFVLGFWIVKVTDVVPFKGIVAAPNTLVIDGGLATVRPAVAVFTVTPLVEVTAPDVFVY